LLPLLMAACGGRSSGAATAEPDGGSQIDAAVDAAAAPIPLFGANPNEYVGLLAFDAANVYAAFFTSEPSTTSACQWSSRWVRIAKDGSSFTVLGDAATCNFDTDASAVVVNGALYWLGEASAEDAGVAAEYAAYSSIMTMPITGGVATHVRDFDAPLDGIGTDGTNLYSTSTDEFGNGSVLRIAIDGTATTLVSGQSGAQWVGMADGNVVWASGANCAAGQECVSNAFSYVPIDGGSVTVITIAPDPVGPATVAASNLYYYDDKSAVIQVSMTGDAGTFTSAPWGSGASNPCYRLRVSGDEAIAACDGTANELLAAPRPYDSPLVDSTAFDVDDGAVYAQKGGVLEKLAPP
jgi:hypothetical protein